MDALSCSPKWERVFIAPTKTLEGCAQALPLLTALRAGEPNIDVVWAIDSRFSWVARHLIPKVGLVELESDWPYRVGHQWSLSRYVRSQRPRLAIDTEGSVPSAIVTRLSGAPCRVGRRSHSLGAVASLFYSHLGDEATFSGKRGDWLLSSLGIEPVRTELTIPPLPETQRVFLDAWMHSAHLSGNFVIAQIGTEPSHQSPTVARALGWTARHLGRQHRLVTVIAADPSQAAATRFAEAVVHHAGGHALVAPAVHPCTLMTLWRQARFVLSADPGIVLLAAAVGLPTLGLHRPTLRPGKHWFPHRPLFMMNPGATAPEWDEELIGDACRRLLGDGASQDAQAA